VSFDPGEGSAEFVVDCEVCCRPATISITVADGEIQNVQATVA
jgi:hypothetical protein